ncbi:PHP domain-containing protein [Caloramator sp. E03]|uniref:PHP domain-containing protein n=1 Tax=Caloramator sp. E03 TaxID=2576307 RepID=UPI00143D538C|nr:PHP domain-containing protein [Caloramator sp. E03]
MIEYDLHIHSTASDGLLDPNKIFEVAKKKGLKGFSITDHDTVYALDTCNSLSKKYKIDFIPGIELSTYFNELEVHILGYYIDYKNEELLEFLSYIQQSRIQRINKMVERIKDLGYDISIEEIRLQADSKTKSLGRPHIGRLLVKKGYFKDTIEAFENLLERGKPGYVERYKLSTEDAIALIKKVGGLPVIAHPFVIDEKLNLNDIKQLIIKFKECGAIGIEVFHSLQNNKQSEFLYKIALENDMVITGGSDCHGILNNGEYLLGNYGINSTLLKRLESVKR